jgi:hypothetical protein
MNTSPNEKHDRWGVILGCMGSIPGVKCAAR